MPKATIQQVIDFLGQVGVPDVEIVDDGADFETDGALSAVDAARSKILRPQIEHELNDTANNAATGRLTGTLASYISGLTGMPRAELMKLPYKDIVQAGFEHLKGSFDGDKQNFAVKLQEMADAHNTTLTTKEKEWYDKYQEAEKRYIDRDIIEYLTEELKDAPFLASVDRINAARLLKADLEKEYSLKTDEKTKRVLLKDKSNPELDIYNDSKTAVLKPFDKAKDFFMPLGIWQTDTRNMRADEAGKGRQQQQPSQQPHTRKGDPTMEGMNKWLAGVELPTD